LMSIPASPQKDLQFQMEEKNGYGHYFGQKNGNKSPVSQIPDLHNPLSNSNKYYVDEEENLSNETKLKNINKFSLPRNSPSAHESSAYLCPVLSKNLYDSQNFNHKTSFLPQYDQFHKDSNSSTSYRSKSADEEESSNPSIRTRANSTTSFEGKSFWSRRNKSQKKNPSPLTTKQNEGDNSKKFWVSKKTKNKSVKFSENEGTKNVEEKVDPPADDFYQISCQFVSKDQLSHILEDCLLKMKLSFKQFKKEKFFRVSYTSGQNVVKFTITICNGSHKVEENSKIPLLLEFYRESGDYPAYSFICKKLGSLIQ